MSDQWYFSWDEKTFGPFSGDALKELAALGRLQLTDLVWKEGSAKRVLAAKVHHLFPEFHAHAGAPDENRRATHDVPSPASPPHELYGSKEPPTKKLAPWASLTNYHADPDEQTRKMIPDGLELKELAPDKNSHRRESDAEESEDDE
jgi:hypothetical protein